MVLTVYKLAVSPPSRSVVMTIQALGLTDVVYKDINVLKGENRTEEYVKMNPQHTIPAIEDDDFVLWDRYLCQQAALEFGRINAICMYLVQKYGKDDTLYPKDLKQRAVVNQRLHFNSGMLFAALKRTIEPIVYGNEKTHRPENKDKMREAFDFLEQFLTDKWLAGDQLTIADLCCLPTVVTLNEIVPVTEDRWPKIHSWLSRSLEFDFVKESHEASLAAMRRMMGKPV